MHVFYSWQSDTPYEIGKNFIRRAIDQAVDLLSDELNLEEAERPLVDQDTQGKIGSPIIAETIFEKLREADVVIVDVTMTGSTESGKKTINSNVAYELGFAHGVSGHEVMVKVMNGHYGNVEELPFDLRHRRGPITYNLSPDCSNEERRNERSKLAKTLSEILAEYLRVGSKKKPIERTPFTINPASYWEQDEKLIREARFGQTEVDLTYSSDQPLIFMRFSPMVQLPPLTGKELADYDVTRVAPLIGAGISTSWKRNRYGTICYSSDDHATLLATTQVMKNREIWGVDAALFRDKSDRGYDFNFLPTQGFEQGIRRSFREYIAAAKKLGYGRGAIVEAGMVNVDGARLAMSSNYLERFWGPIYENSFFIQVTIDMDENDTIENAVTAIFERVFDAAGHERPGNLG